MGKARKRSTRTGVGGHRHKPTGPQRAYLDAIASIAKSGREATVRAISEAVDRSENAVKRMLTRLEQLRLISRGRGESGKGRPIRLIAGNPGKKSAARRARIGRKVAELPDAALPKAERCLDDAAAKP